MDYDQTVEYLYNQLPVYQRIGGAAYKEGLDNSLALDKYFNHPHKSYKTIHIAGTNGKGSTSHLLAAILQQAGYKVGLYTSPHLVDFRERIRINGSKIDKQYVIDFVQQHREYYESIHPSFFELTMMMAFCYFRDMDVDFAIIEVGLGGRLDSTNIITPVLSVITNISYDHIQFLGDTLEKIATEKAGIIKKNIPIVIGEADGSVRKVFEETAHRVGTSIVFAEDEKIIKSSNQVQDGFIYQTEKYPNLKGELGGLAQKKNTATVLSSIRQLKNIGFEISNKAVYEGFEKVTSLTGLMGRWQILQNNPKIICDTGHNTAGIKYVCEQLATEKYDQLHIILGVVNDKDISSILQLLPKNAIYYFTKASIMRALDEKELKALATSYQLHGEAYLSVKEAFESALKKSNNNDLIFIGGSNFIVADLLDIYGSFKKAVHS